MLRVATYVFIDFETTGLPKEEFNRTKITELSMVAVKRDHLFITRPGSVPRVQHKLTLCLNPRRLVSVIATETTGLCNDLLENEPAFNLEVFNMINTFLNVLTKPVCLIAQNGLGFDYPILKNHLVKLNVSLSDDLLCADCYHGFYDILEKKKHDLKIHFEGTKLTDFTDLNLSMVSKASSSTDELNLPSNAGHSPNGKKSLNEENLLSYEENTPNGANSINLTDYIDSPSPSKTSVESNLTMQAINETTPKRQKTEPTLTRISKVRRRMPWGKGPKPLQSYKLKDIYERVLNKAPIDPHRAEHDCILALEVAVALSAQFVEWVDHNYVLFSDINPMTIGVPLGF